jgi:hypothetical protein
VDTLELSSIAEHDQLGAEMVQRAGVIAQFYRSLVQGGLPTDLAATIVTDWVRTSFQLEETFCSCDCESCREYWAEDSPR